MIDRDEVRVAIAETPGETLKDSAARAAYTALLAAQKAGAPGSIRAGLLVAYAEEARAMQAAVDEFGRSPGI